MPRAFGFAITGHFDHTAQAAGFAGLLNGELMEAMKAGRFDVLVTFDQNLPYQQNAVLPVAVVVLVAPNNRVETALRFVPSLLNVLESLKTGQLVKLAHD